jgi:hypothetical protein
MAWKSAYSLGGTYTNFGECDFTVVRATLVETAVTDGAPPRQLQTLDLGPVGSGANSGPVAFDAITQSWAWFDDITFLQTAPVGKFFVYTVALTAQDPWGNEHQVSSPPLSLFVSVPSWKVTDQGLAATSAATSAVLLAAAAAAAAVPGIGWAAAAGYFGAAQTAYGIAQGFGSAAKDPPEPDSSYREIVQVKILQVPTLGVPTPTARRARPAPSGRGRTSVEAVAAQFQVVLQTAAYREALSTTENRILGASQAGDREALDMQVARHTELTNSMSELQVPLTTSTAGAIQATQGDHVLDPDVIRATLEQWKLTGVPQEVTDQWLHAGHPQSVLSALETVIAQTSFGALVVPFPLQLAAIASGAQNWLAGATSSAAQLV